MLIAKPLIHISFFIGLPKHKIAATGLGTPIVPSDKVTIKACIGLYPQVDAGSRGTSHAPFKKHGGATVDIIYEEFGPHHRPNLS